AAVEKALVIGMAYLVNDADAGRLSLWPLAAESLSAAIGITVGRLDQAAAGSGEAVTALQGHVLWLLAKPAAQDDSCRADLLAALVEEGGDVRWVHWITSAPGSFPLRRGQASWSAQTRVGTGSRWRRG